MKMIQKVLPDICIDSGGKGGVHVEKRMTLLGVKNEHEVTAEADHEFLYELKRGLLLALREKGYLSDLQLREAEKRLRAEMCNTTRKGERLD